MKGEANNEQAMKLNTMDEVDRKFESSLFSSFMTFSLF